jgi:hypothetical protein
LNFRKSCSLLDLGENIYHYEHMTDQTEASGSTRHIINVLFDGRQDVARVVGSTAKAVDQWHRIGVPSKFWPTLVNEAAARGIEGVTFDALQATKPKRNA